MNFTDLEIIIVPITPGNKQPLSEIALQAYKNHKNHHHHAHSRKTVVGGHHRESGRHQHLPDRPRLTGKLSSDLAVSRKIKSIRSRKDAATRGLARNIADSKGGQQRTPYNHRGWLY